MQSGLGTQCQADRLLNCLDSIKEVMKPNSEHHALNSPQKIWRRWIEFVLIFVVGPTVFAINIRNLGTRLIFPAIWMLAGVCLIVLLLDPTFRKRRLWNARNLRRAWKPLALWFLTGGVALAGLLAVYEPERLFHLARTDPLIWAIVMVAYPILSVYPQEIAFRAFFFHRYRKLFGHGRAGRWSFVLVSAAAFGYAHIVMHNAWAVLFSTVGGVLFAYTYLRSRSLLAVWIEHAAYGCFLFTIGWGYYFFGGSLNG